MTRRGLLASVLTAPLAALASAAGLGAEKPERFDIAFLPGTIRIREGGGIKITGATDVRVEGCLFENCTIT